MSMARPSGSVLLRGDVTACVVSRLTGPQELLAPLAVLPQNSTLLPPLTLRDNGEFLRFPRLPDFIS